MKKNRIIALLINEIDKKYGDNGKFMLTLRLYRSNI